MSGVRGVQHLGLELGVVAMVVVDSSVRILSLGGVLTTLILREPSAVLMPQPIRLMRGSEQKCHAATNVGQSRCDHTKCQSRFFCLWEVHLIMLQIAARHEQRAMCAGRGNKVSTVAHSPSRSRASFV